MSEIWFVNQYAISPEMPGGTRHFDLASELVRRGERVRIFASDLNLSLRRRTKLKDNELYACETIDGVEFVWVRSAEYDKNNWRRTWNMLSFAQNFGRVGRIMARSGRPDIIIGSSPHLFAPAAARRFAAKTGARFVLELRDLWPQALIDMGGLREEQLTVRMLRGLEKSLYQSADLIVILARGSQQYLTARGVPQERILYIPNGVHAGHFQPTMSREEARARFGMDRFTVVYAGAHGPANALETVVEASRHIDPERVQFLLVGDGPSKRALVELAERHGSTGLRFHDPVPKSAIPDLLHAADAGVITLMNIDAFAYGVSPNKLFDYMAARLPVLCSVPGDMADMVCEAQAGWALPPCDAEALAKAAQQFAALSPSALAEMGSSGADYVLKHYSREALANQLAAAFAQLRAQAGPR